MIKFNSNYFLMQMPLWLLITKKRNLKKYDSFNFILIPLQFNHLFLIMVIMLLLLNFFQIMKNFNVLIFFIFQFFLLIFFPFLHPLFLILHQYLYHLFNFYFLINFLFNFLFNFLYH